MEWLLLSSYILLNTVGQISPTLTSLLCIYPVSAVLTAVSTKPSLPAIVWKKNSVGVSPEQKLFDTKPLALGVLAGNKTTINELSCFYEGIVSQTPCTSFFSGHHKDEGGVLVPLHEDQHEILAKTKANYQIWTRQQRKYNIFRQIILFFGYEKQQIGVGKRMIMYHYLQNPNGYTYNVWESEVVIYPRSHQVLSYH